LNLSLLVGAAPYRNPALFAKVTTTLDVISGGRAIHGIGAAWNEEEATAYGYDFPPLRDRFEILEDALNIARAMFTESPASCEGKRHSISGAFNNPRPVRGDIPIMVGGSGEKKTLRMVAQYADASNFFGDADRLRHLIGVLEDHCERLGRDPAEITTTRLGTAVIAPTHEQAEAKLDALRDRVPPERLATALAGDPDTVAEKASELLDAGIEGLIFNSPDVHDLETVQLLGETLSPLVAERVG
jgi:alkanesulfonate monooxygenase SsuD/methylene tetrahydromethanopterin reductase-like flavin-dependent oxidoreductase (luciferase family)